MSKTPEFDDVMHMLSAFFKKVPGYVYAVQFEDGAVKIGSTKNATERFYTLQNYYRGKRSLIVNTYISEFSDDAREDEHRAQSGLKAIEKKEVYNISFGDAVRRIKKATNTKTHFATIGREETISVFPCLHVKYKEQCTIL